MIELLYAILTGCSLVSFILAMFLLRIINIMSKDIKKLEAENKKLREYINR